MTETDPPSLIVRADAGPAIGLGHVMRGLSVAESARAAGWSVTFASPPLPPSVADRLRAGRIIHQTPAAASGRADVMLVDGYGFPLSDYAQWRDACRCLAVIDDMGEKAEMPVDILINPGPQADPAMYERSGAQPRLLLGPDYLPLRPEFREAAPRDRERETANRILVTMGGSDPGNSTPAVLAGLLEAETPLEIRAVLGGLADDVALPETPRHSLIIERDVADMTRLMTWADVAVSAAGSTLWELASLGVPTVAVVAAENQRAGAEAAAARGMLLVSKPEDAAAEGLALLSDSTARRRLSETARRFVDGRGAERIVEIFAAELASHR